MPCTLYCKIICNTPPRKSLLLAVEAFEKIPSPRRAALAHLRIGQCYRAQRDFPNAILAFKESLRRLRAVYGKQDHGNVIAALLDLAGDTSFLVELSVIVMGKVSISHLTSSLQHPLSAS